MCTLQIRNTLRTSSNSGSVIEIQDRDHTNTETITLIKEFRFRWTNTRVQYVNSKSTIVFVVEGIVTVSESPCRGDHSWSRRVFLPLVTEMSLKVSESVRKSIHLS